MGKTTTIAKMDDSKILQSGRWNRCGMCGHFLILHEPIITKASVCSCGCIREQKRKFQVSDIPDMEGAQ
jgi:hypothetical protein